MDKKHYLQTGSGILLLFVFLVGRSVMEQYQTEKAYKTARNINSSLESNLNNLSQEERAKFYELRGKASQIVYNHLDDQDKIKYNDFVTKKIKTDTDFVKNEARIQKIKPKLTEGEKSILNEWEEMVSKVSGTKLKRLF